MRKLYVITFAQIKVYLFCDDIVLIAALKSSMGMLAANILPTNLERN